MSRSQTTWTVDWLFFSLNSANWLSEIIRVTGGGGGPRESPTSSAAASAMTVKNLLERIKKNGGLCQATEEKPLCVCVCVWRGKRTLAPPARSESEGARPIVCDVHQKRVREKEREGGPWLFSGWAECGVVVVRWGELASVRHRSTTRALHTQNVCHFKFSLTCLWLLRREKNNRIKNDRPCLLFGHRLDSHHSPVSKISDNGRVIRDISLCAERAHNTTHTHTRTKKKMSTHLDS